MKGKSNQKVGKSQVYHEDRNPRNIRIYQYKINCIKGNSKPESRQQAGKL